MSVKKLNHLAPSYSLQKLNLITGADLTSVYPRQYRNI